MTLTATRAQRRSPSPAWTFGLCHGDRRQPASPVGGADDDQPGPSPRQQVTKAPTGPTSQEPFSGQRVPYGPYPATTPGFSVDVTSVGAIRKKRGDDSREPDGFNRRRDHGTS